MKIQIRKGRLSQLGEQALITKISIKLKKRNWKKYAFEFLSIFVAVIAAFALNNWNDNRKDNIAESKILTEILNGLEKDETDIEINLIGHQQGINACKFWRSIINDEPRSLDSLLQYYLALTRDFISIQNTSGYETLKSRGFELIDNDSLRTEIISLYEYDYQALRKFEEEYFELQFQENYYRAINSAIAPYFSYDVKGNITSIKLPLQLTESERKILLSYLWKIQFNRRFVMTFYDEVKTKIDELQKEIGVELSNNY